MQTQQLQFHVMDDVCVPSTLDCGYVFAVSESENMLLIKSYDGKYSQWVHPDEIERFNKAFAKALIS